MKKGLIVLALVAFLATGTAFAELTGVGAPTVSGSVSTSYGYDLDSEAHGFYNDSDFTLTLPLLDGSETKGGDDNMYGEISVSGIGWQLTNDGLYDVDEDDDATNTSVLDVSIDAKLVLNSLFIDLGAPDFDFNFVDVSDDYIVDANFWTDDAPALQGISVGFMNDMLTIEARVANRNDGYKDDSDDDVEAVDEYGTGFENDLSDGGFDDFTANTRGYTLGAAVTVTPAEGVTIPVVFSYDLPNSIDNYMGFGMAPSVAMGMMQFDLPLDYVMIDDVNGLEVNPALTYYLTEKGGSSVAANFLYGTYTDVALNYTYYEDLNDNGVEDIATERITVTDTIENAVGAFGLTFTESETMGFVPGLAAMLEVTLTDMFDYLDAGDDMGWDVAAEASYNMDGLKPYVNTAYGSSEVLELGMGLVMMADFTGLDNTTLTLDYTNDALTESDAGADTESGRVTFDVTVSF